MSVPPKEILNYLNPAVGGFSSVQNPGSVSPRGLQSWSNYLGSQQPEFRDPAEVEAYNAQLQSPAMMGVAPQYPIPQQVPGFNVPEQAPEAAQMPSQLPQISQAPEADPYGYMEKGLLGAADLEAKAARNVYNASRSIAQQEQAALQGRMDAADAFATQSQKIADERDAAVSGEMSRLNDLGKKAADGKVTPFWAKASTEQKIGAGLAMALGAFGASFSKGPNYAMQIIDKAIDDDIRSQMANIDQNNKAFANQREYVSDIKGLYRDRLEQTLALKSMAYDKVENQLLSIASKNKELMALPNFQMALANNQQNKIKTQAELAKMRADTLKVEAEAKTGGANQSNLIPGYGYAPTPEDAKEGKALNSIAGRMLSNIQKLKQLREEVGSNAFSPSARSRAKAIARDLQLDYKSPQLAQLGVLAGPDLEILEDIIPTNPLGVGFVMDRLNQAEDLLKTRVNSFYESRGFIKPSDAGSQQQQGDPLAEAKQAYQWSVEALRKNSKDPKAREVFNRSKSMLGM